MAKVIRSCWVYRKQGRWWGTLPRRDDNVIRYDYEAAENSLTAFPDPMPNEPTKLLVAWIFREIGKHRRYGNLRYHLRMLFGDDLTPGVLNVFKNTISTNKELWKVKHLIEVHPLTFPDGEPTIDDVNHLEITHDGRCVIDKRKSPSTEGVELFDVTKQFSPTYLGSRLMSRDQGFKDIYEDTAYNPANIAVFD